MSKEQKSTSKYAVHRTQPVAPAARSVTANPGTPAAKTYTATTPVKGSARVVNTGRKD